MRMVPMDVKVAMYLKPIPMASRSGSLIVLIDIEASLTIIYDNCTVSPAYHTSNKNTPQKGPCGR